MNIFISLWTEMKYVIYKLERIIFKILLISYNLNSPYNSINVQKRMNLIRLEIRRDLMIRKLRRLLLIVVLLAIAWPLAGTSGQLILRTEAPLFDSVDENFNPVSMTDKIDGKPLVLAVSSCT